MSDIKSDPLICNCTLHSLFLQRCCFGTCSYQSEVSEEPFHFSFVQSSPRLISVGQCYLPDIWQAANHIMNHGVNALTLPGPQMPPGRRLCNMRCLSCSESLPHPLELLCLAPDLQLGKKVNWNHRWQFWRTCKLFFFLLVHTVFLRKEELLI